MGGASGMDEKPKKKRRMQKKAPGAPKRGKSAYIMYSMDKREEIKARLPKDTSVTDVMKAIAKEWAQLNDRERQPWVQLAEADKQRYEEEMATYDGPLRVPNKRAKKHPDAPKRAASAFLFYSKIYRPKLKEDHPGLKNTDVSRELGLRWAKLSAKDRKPYVAQEKADRARYKKEMIVWNAQKTEREYAERERNYRATQNAYGGFVDGLTTTTTSGRPQAQHPSSSSASSASHV